LFDTSNNHALGYIDLRLWMRLSIGQDTEWIFRSKNNTLHTEIDRRSARKEGDGILRI
jgi:hypothetical protein